MEYPILIENKRDAITAINFDNSKLEEGLDKIIFSSGIGKDINSIF